jgi:hypothetical protein
MVKASLILFTLAAPAAYAADCAIDQDPYSSCHIADRGRNVSVCYNTDVATYRYGPINGPDELTLSETIDALNYRPWSGVGRDVAESVTFYNGDYSYEVVIGYSQGTSATPDENGDPEPENRQYGWISVGYEGAEIARLTCDPETAFFGFGGGIYDLKVAMGYDWDDYDRVWAKDPN